MGRQHLFHNECHVNKFFFLLEGSSFVRQGRCAQSRHCHLAVSFHLCGWEMPNTSAGNMTNGAEETLALLGGLCSESTEVSGKP